MPDSFVHLHTHSCYSLLDGLARVDDLVRTASEAEMPALALTDHGAMFGAIEFYKKAQEAGIKPIVGCEIYVADRPLAERATSGAKNFHLVLLAENETGYRNLIRLTSAAHLEGFYRKPRVDHDLLASHSEGLICLSACASSEVAARILADDLPGAEAVADWHRSVFPNRYFLELQYHEVELQAKINQGIVHLSQRLALPVVATNDVHYAEARHARAHDVLLCIQTQTTLDEPKRMRMGSQEFYLKSAEQMTALFGELPGAVSNTLAIAERCDLQLSFGRLQFPPVETPDGVPAIDYLRSLCETGMADRYHGRPDHVRERLEYELGVIERTGFVEYLLLVYDVIHFARGSGIAVGPGRGSAAGSLVAFCLRITNVDPVAHGLSFERFLNPERVTMPDMDLDFGDDRRDEVIRYVADKYGRDHVAQIITFGTIGPRAGVRDVGRVLGLPLADVDRVAKLVPFMCNKVSRAKEEVPELRQLYESDQRIQEVLDLVEDLEGVARHASTHAAGVVISREPLAEHVPLYKVPKSDVVTTQYAMASIEEIGLLKMDFLGLRTLTIIDRACRFISRSKDGPFSPDDIPLDDPSIYKLLSSGDNFGIFQVDGQGMRRFIQQLKPTEFEHVVALIAMYRPGPMQFLDEFVARKNGERHITYDHHALEEVLRSTFGIAVYQEQVMRLAVLVAGYTMGEADLLRRAMAKKKPDELAKHREQFIERAAARGTDRALAEHLFGVIEPFAGYAFPKAHSAAYAVTTCQTAYLKANYPAEFLAGYLSAERENSDKIAAAIAECRRLGIGILPPDVNRSELDFALEEGGIRFGLGAVKNVGTGAIESLLAERSRKGLFGSLDDLCARLDWTAVGKRVLESLTRCGVFDSLGIERGQLLASVDRIVSFGSRAQRAAAAGQGSLFGTSSDAVSPLHLSVAQPASLEDRVSWEQELLGTPITPHPVVHAEPRFLGAGAIPIGQVASDHNNRTLRVGGMIRAIRSSSTKDGRPMAGFSLTDLQTSIDAIVFSRNYEALQAKLIDGTIVVVDGKLEAAEGRVRLLVERMYTLDEAGDHPFRPNGNGRRNGKAIGHAPLPDGSANLHAAAIISGPSRRFSIEFTRGSDRGADADRLVQVYAALQRFPGPDEVEILVRAGSRLRTVPLPNTRIGYCPELESELRRLVGERILLNQR